MTTKKKSSQDGKKKLGERAKKKDQPSNSQKKEEKFELLLNPTVQNILADRVHFRARPGDRLMLLSFVSSVPGMNMEAGRFLLTFDHFKRFAEVVQKQKAMIEEIEEKADGQDG